MLITDKLKSYAAANRDLVKLPALTYVVFGRTPANKLTIPSGWWQGFFYKFYPVPNGRPSRTIEMRLATDIGRDDQLRFAAFQRIEPIFAQLLGKFRLGDRIRAR